MTMLLSRRTMTIARYAYEKQPGTSSAARTHANRGGRPTHQVKRLRPVPAQIPYRPAMPLRQATLPLAQRAREARVLALRVPRRDALAAQVVAPLPLPPVVAAVNWYT